MELLAAVNRILPKLGEHPVTSLESRSPTLAVLLPLIDAKIIELTTQGWWFNTHITTLAPDPDGLIAMPVGTLSFIADDYECSNRAGQLHNSVDNTFVWEDSVVGKIIMLLEFEELPEPVAQWVFYSVLVDMYITDIGVTKEAQAWQGMINVSERLVLSEHLRNKRYSTQRSRRYGRIRSAMRG